MSAHDRTYWRSLDELGRLEAGTPTGERRHEFEAGADELEVDASAVSRRRFLSLVGAGATLAGLGPLAGCIRQPEDHILPYAQRPESLIPGNPRRYATSAMIGGGVLGLLVESQDGRPTKIEGLPLHPMSLGAASAWAQAEVLSLYDPERSRVPRLAGKESSWDAFTDFAGPHFSALRNERGQGLAVLIDYRPSPTFRRLLGELQRAFPRVELFLHDETFPRRTREGAALVGLKGGELQIAPDHADVMLALDADFLGTEGDAVRNGKLFARRRRVMSQHSTMNRLYVVEAALSLTGAAADNRLRLRPSEVEAFTLQLLAELVAQGLKLPEGAASLKTSLPAAGGERFGKWPAAVARDLLPRRGRSLVVVGERQPARVHALGWLLNEALENLGKTLDWVPQPEVPELPGLPELCASLRAKKVGTLLVLGGNPVQQAPGELDLAACLASAKQRIHLSSHLDETSRLCSWHLPLTHFLEAWGDWRASDGTLSMQQPLIAPIHASRSELEVLALVAGSKLTRGYDLVRETWRARAEGKETTDFDKRWRRWLHDGLVSIPGPHSRPAVPRLEHAGLLQSTAGKPREASPRALEAVFQLDSRILDGRYAGNGWLQELPDPISKVTWDNAAYLGPATAAALEVRPFDLVELSLDGRKVELPALIIPGIADHTVVLLLGYGRKGVGEIARAGFDVAPIRRAASPWSAAGVVLRRVGRRHPLAITQEHWSMEGRPLIREATIGTYQKNPDFAKQKLPPLKSLWEEPVERRGRQWGMSIDLNACTGCGACTVACQAENNIPVVGKRRVIENREMHWIRVDRYFAGPPGDPEVRYQPIPCMHCETAPCEQVCPVMASAHSPEGLNDQAYNRCIGTRYCSNNCPYKVRRFNFFQYNKGLDPLVRMQKNPDVTLRFRGIMEKCTYCVQRIQEAKIGQKAKGTDIIPDGMVVPACVQTCPAEAIVFGDINDETSQVAARKREARSYAILAELNTKPRTTYLAKLKNPNPELA